MDIEKSLCQIIDKVVSIEKIALLFTSGSTGLVYGAKEISLTMYSQ